MTVFLSSTIGVPLYSHVCMENNGRFTSLLQEEKCHEEQEVNSCCSSDGQDEHSDCCDLHFSFEKYIPSADINHFSLIKKIVDIAQPLFFAPQLILTINNIDERAFKARPPNLYLKHPKSVSLRLAQLQSYLC